MTASARSRSPPRCGRPRPPSIRTGGSTRACWWTSDRVAPPAGPLSAALGARRRRVHPLRARAWRGTGEGWSSSVIAVLGPGGVGGLVAAALARAGEDVVVVAREETAAVIAGRGITVRSVVLGEFEARPRVAPVLDEPAEILVVATKATGLEAALTRIQAPAALIVPLLNGVEHIVRLRDRFGVEAVSAGVIRVESDRPEPGVIEQTSPSIRIDLAPSWPHVLEAARRVGGAGTPPSAGGGRGPAMW